MISSRLHLLVLAAPCFLSACGSSADQPVDIGHSAEVRSARDVAAVTAARATTIFRGPRASFTIARSGTGHTVTDRLSGAVTELPMGVRLRFNDTSIALDIDGAAGQVYRLYRSAFKRAPDVAGLSGWIQAMDGGASFDAVASDFGKSAEFKTLYGENPSNAAMIARLYLNILGREGDRAGVEHWNSMLDKKLITQVQLMVAFSESAENRAAVAPLIELGIGYTEPGVPYALPPTASDVPYRMTPLIASGAEALDSLNKQGALGYAYAGGLQYIGLTMADSWMVSLYAKGPSAVKYSYEFIAPPVARWEDELVKFQELGARGYLYKHTAFFSPWTGPGSGWGYKEPRYDVFVKGSRVATTYHYRIDEAPFTAQTLNVQGAQGYRFLSKVYTHPKTYNLYVRDMNSNTVYDYVEAEYKQLNDGLMEQLDTMGAASYAYLGEIYRDAKPVALFSRSSDYRGPYVYTAMLMMSDSPQADVKLMSERALKGEAYWGRASPNFAIFYRGSPITRPFQGVTFP